ncbi:MAG TPA: hypothetical protein PKA64_10265, partial [Myxococcota bacterium]|nr:hypothetical protein [Myxococcota bacterium]
FAVSRRFGSSLVDRKARAAIEERLAAAAPELGPALDAALRELYANGIAFHHAGLHVQLKALVEELYEAKLISVLFCTSTFALGINMPARSVAFHGLMKFDGQEVRPLTTRGFMQKAGRAGRRGMDEHGHVVLRMDPHEYNELKPVIERYRKQIYEPVRSSFSLSFHSIVNLLERHGLEPIRRVVDRSFLSWHLVQQSREQLKRAEVLERHGGKQEGKEARKLRTRAEKSESACWDELQRKRNFLHTVGYLDADDGFNAGARILRHIQIAEILMTELVLSGELEDLDMPTLFGVLCACSGDLPRGAQPNWQASRKDRDLANRLGRVRMNAAVTGSEQITGMPVTWCPEMITIGRTWAEGKSLAEILMMVRSSTDVSGTLVSNFRRAKDLIGQLREVYDELPERANALRDLLRSVARDEVEVVD